MKFFEIKGEFSQKGEKKKFAKKVKADSHKFAAEKVMCLIGSEHKIKRRHIILNDVKEMGEENGGKRGN
tara:strand:- start:1355 stop:1561 length:207 start_codon:yes stop_codon:yes gene_type:complete